MAEPMDIDLPASAAESTAATTATTPAYSEDAASTTQPDAHVDGENPTETETDANSQPKRGRVPIPDIPPGEDPNAPPRKVSRRRTREGILKLRGEITETVQELQTSLQVTLTQLESVQAEHDRLDGNNKFLQKYIGELMSTSNITGGKK